MKILINEKQLEYLKNKLYEESTESESTEPTVTDTSSTSSTPSTDTSITYPEVGKWESGVTRGAGNQIGNTNWSDVVGSQLTRGKGNKLK